MTSSVSPPNLGLLVNERRKSKALTLDALASASGVSRSMLSQIERGEASPTFSTLWNITRALDIGLDELMAAPADDVRDIDLVLDYNTPQIRTSDGLCVLRILSPAEAAGKTEWYLLSIDPGGALVSAAHTRGTAEHLTVLSGAMDVTASSSQSRVSAGETARYDAGVAHSICNHGDTLATAMLVVITAAIPI